MGLKVIESSISMIPYQFDYLPNGVRYLLVGGTRSRHFAGTHSKPRKALENAATPTSQVHAVLGNLAPAVAFAEKDNTANMTGFYNELDFWQHPKRLL